MTISGRDDNWVCKSRVVMTVPGSRSRRNVRPKTLGGGITYEMAGHESTLRLDIVGHNGRSRLETSLGHMDVRGKLHVQRHGIRLHQPSAIEDTDFDDQRSRLNSQR